MICVAIAFAERKAATYLSMCEREYLSINRVCVPLVSGDNLLARLGI